MTGDLFLEAFLTRLVPIFSEVTLGAIRHFHPEQYSMGAVTAATGALLASLLLYGMGYWLRRWPEKVSTPEQQQRIERMRAPAAHWLPWLLILSPTPFGGVLTIAAGFFRIKPFIAAIAIIAAEILWRASPFLTATH